MDDTSLPHPTDAFLFGNHALTPQADLRQAVLQQTTRVLRRRRWWRRARLVGTLAACYLAGILTVPWTRLLNERPPPQVAERTVGSPQPATEPHPAGKALLPVSDETALALEWRALESSEQRAELYRLAGDRYLEREGDLQSALRCYGQALDAGSNESLAVAASDNWLLMALKEARLREKDHVQNGS